MNKFGTVTVRQARSLLVKNVDTLETIGKELIKAMGYVMAEDIFSPIDLPPFTSSAMDGYAVHSSDIRNKLPVRLKIKGEIRAGDFKRINVAKGEAVRIFTGAPLPSGSDCVVMQEQTQKNGDFILIEKHVSRRENIRFKGEEIKKSQKVLSKGTVINPGVIAFLSIMGIEKVRVIRVPVVQLIVTGNELVSPGIPLRPGHVYDSNSFSIHSALKKMGIEKIRTVRKGDSLKAIQNAFERAVIESDIIILTGGISVGKYDSVRELFKMIGVETIFYKVEQKPGKPIYFGSCDGKFVFGLPGNPVSTLVCFYEYVYPALRKMMGVYPNFLEEKKMILLNNIRKKVGKVNFLRGKYNNDAVVSLKNQDSHMLSSFAKANCLIVVPSNKKLLEKGEKVRVHILPI